MGRDILLHTQYIHDSKKVQINLFIDLDDFATDSVVYLYIEKPQDERVS